VPVTSLSYPDPLYTPCHKHWLSALIVSGKIVPTYDLDGDYCIFLLGTLQCSGILTTNSCLTLFKYVFSLLISIGTQLHLLGSFFIVSPGFSLSSQYLKELGFILFVLHQKLLNKAL
jgi:hypothetical protein